MDKYLLLLGNILIASSITISLLIGLRCNHRLRQLVGMVIDTARSHNIATYNIARYIEADLQQKAQNRDLTEEEQEHFHEARKMINHYEIMQKEGRS